VETTTASARESIAVAAIAVTETIGGFPQLVSIKARTSQDLHGAASRDRFH